MGKDKKTLFPQLMTRPSLTRGMSMNPIQISTLILSAKGNLSDVPEKEQKELRSAGPGIRSLSFNQQSSLDVRQFEWTAEKIEQLVSCFPNLEELNLDGSLVRELNSFCGALSKFSRLKNLKLNDITLKDSHIENIMAKTKVNALNVSLSISGIQKRLDPVFPRIHVYDSRMDELFHQDAQIEKLADGFEWVEGPIWNQEEGCLLFSDIPRNSIFKYKDGEGVTLFRNPSGYHGKSVYKGKEPGSNGLTFDSQGRLHVCQHGERRIVRIEPNGDEVVVADSYKGKRLNSPNDLVFKSTGELFFTDPPYGLPLRFDDPEKELSISGIYRVKDGKVELMTDELMVPNGLAFSPDEKYLYVSNTGNKTLKDPPRWYRFEVKEDGTLGKKEIFYEASSFSERRPGSPDGLKIDEKGNLYCAGPGGIYVFSPDATLLGMIEFAQPTANLNWGGKDRSVLYIASNHAIYSVQLKVKGAGAL